MSDKKYYVKFCLQERKIHFRLVLGCAEGPDEPPPSRGLLSSMPRSSVTVVGTLEPIVQVSAAETRDEGLESAHDVFAGDSRLSD